MTDVVDRRWGQSLVRAPTAKDAAQPEIATRRPAPAAVRTPVVRPRLMPRRNVRPPVGPDTIPMAAWDAAAVGGGRGRLVEPDTMPSPGRAMVAAVPPANRPASPVKVGATRPTVVRPPEPGPTAATPPPAIVPTPTPEATAPDVRVAPPSADVQPPVAEPPSGPAVMQPHVQPPVAERQPGPAALQAPSAQPPVVAERQPGPAVLQAPSAQPSVVDLRSGLADDPSLARLARGIQDCARALACLADRLGGLDRRLDAFGTPAPDPDPPLAHTAPSGHADLQVTAPGLEGIAAGSPHAADHIRPKLETLPTTVGRLRTDTDGLADRTRARVGEVERTVLEIRRNLERNLSAHVHRARSPQPPGTRLEGLAVRLVEMGSSAS